MKIGILTHRPVSNYGGILQAYALSKILESLGHEVVLIRRRATDPKIKRLLRNILVATGIKKLPTSNLHALPQQEFVERELRQTTETRTRGELRKLLRSEDIEGVVIGSDQVWRADYNREYSYDFWGGFLKGLPKIKGISYGASIADDDWSYTGSETKRLRKEVRLLRGYSVRELSAQKQCEENLDIRPEIVADPTLLHDSSFYDKIESGEKPSRPYIFVYWLGDRTDLTPILKKHEDSGAEIIELSLRNPSDFVTIGRWLNLIKNAEHIVTDSFHGVVFSLIYHKSFTIGKNKSGGMGRLASLFTLLGIEEKLSNPEAAIDYETADKHVERLRRKSIEFLKEGLQ
ncbi:MAG: polysaccharide pyruvyl transferase family protein [Clostridium sp.]|nr:polysaccharide pyruvyl transferase family protein [Prevotella sp.]MCM1429486.1 polysaccharide pyruvyl transferase family protein [Clostridium sp.]MCM1476102.1 polysaccharide pyruvyl transferase family protein [Muribaculaceae bacterium]